MLINKLITFIGSKIGERVVLEGLEDKYSQDWQAEVNPKEKILEKCFPLFKTDSEGYAVWNGKSLVYNAT